MGHPKVARFGNFGNRDDCGLLPYGWYVSRPHRQIVEVREALYTLRSQMLDVNHREAVGDSGY